MLQKAYGESTITKTKVKEIATENHYSSLREIAAELSVSHESFSFMVRDTTRERTNPFQLYYELNLKYNFKDSFEALKKIPRSPSEMDKALSADDFAAIESQLKDSVEQDRRYWKVNDVKCDAIYSAKTYEEFADRVAAAHLNPLHNADFKKKCPRKWNQYATDDKKSDE